MLNDDCVSSVTACVSVCLHAWPACARVNVCKYAFTCLIYARTASLADEQTHATSPQRKVPRTSASTPPPPPPHPFARLPAAAAVATSSPTHTRAHRETICGPMVAAAAAPIPRTPSRRPCKHHQHAHSQIYGTHCSLCDEPTAPVAVAAAVAVEHAPE